MAEPDVFEALAHQGACGLNAWWNGDPPEQPGAQDVAQARAVLTAAGVPALLARVAELEAARAAHVAGQDTQPHDAPTGQPTPLADHDDDATYVDPASAIRPARPDSPEAIRARMVEMASRVDTDLRQRVREGVGDWTSYAESALDPSQVDEITECVMATLTGGLVLAMPAFRVSDPWRPYTSDGPLRVFRPEDLAGSVDPVTNRWRAEPPPPNAVTRCRLHPDTPATGWHPMPASEKQADGTYTKKVYLCGPCSERMEAIGYPASRDNTGETP